MAYGDFQGEIYFKGLNGTVPTLPMACHELEQQAEAAMTRSVLSCVAGGAGDERIQRANISAIGNWGLIARMFVGAAERDLSVRLFGMTLPAPLFLSPIGVIGLCAQGGHGDIATAQATACTGVPMIASTLTVDPIEQVAPRLADTPSFFQLYTLADKDQAVSLVQRAEPGGFKAIVVTLDTWITDWRPRALSRSSFPQLRGVCLSNCVFDNFFRALLAKTPENVVRFRQAQRCRRGQGSRPRRDRSQSRASLHLRTRARGTDGVVRVLRMLLAEVDLIMAVDGYPTLRSEPGIAEVRQLLW